MYLSIPLCVGLRLRGLPSKFGFTKNKSDFKFASNMSLRSGLLRPVLGTPRLLSGQVAIHIALERRDPDIPSSLMSRSSERRRTQARACVSCHMPMRGPGSPSVPRAAQASSFENCCRGVRAVAALTNEDNPLFCSEPCIQRWDQKTPLWQKEAGSAAI